MKTKGPADTPPSDSGWGDTPRSTIIAEAVERRKQAEANTSQEPMTAAQFEEAKKNTLLKNEQRRAEKERRGDSRPGGLDRRLADIHSLDIDTSGSGYLSTEVGKEGTSGEDIPTNVAQKKQVRIEHILSERELDSLRKKMKEINPGQQRNPLSLPELRRTGILSQEELYTKQDSLLAQINKDLDDFETTVKLDPTWRPSFQEGDSSLDELGGDYPDTGSGGSIFDDYDDTQQNDDYRTTRPSLPVLETSAGYLSEPKKSNRESKQTHNKEPEPLQNPTQAQIHDPDINLSTFSEEFLSQVPTLTDIVPTIPAPLVKESSVPKFTKRTTVRKGLFTSAISYGKSLLTRTSKMFSTKKPKIVIAQEFKPFEEDTLYKDEARINGISKKAYQDWEGLRKETPEEETKRLADEKKRLDEEVKHLAEEKKKRLGEEAYNVAQKAQEDHLKKISPEKRPETTAEQSVLHGTPAPRGLKKILRKIATSFSKNGALERNEMSKLADEIKKRRELAQEDSAHFNQHYRKNDHELTDSRVSDTYLKEYDDKMEDDYLLQLANKREEAREKKVRKDTSLLKRVKLLFNPKERRALKDGAKHERTSQNETEVIEWENVDPDTYKQEILDTQERVRVKMESALNTVTKTTREKREAILQKLGPEGKGFLNMLDRGAEFFDSKVSAKTRIFAGVTLAATGALALYATPAIGTIAVITAAGAGVRVLGASAAYIGIKRTLDKYIKNVDDFNANRDDDDELHGLRVGSAEKKLFALAGAAGAALLGNLAGEYLAPTLGKVLQEYIPQINDTLFSFSREVVPDSSIVTGVENVAQVVPPASVPVTPAVVPDIQVPSVVENIAQGIPPEILKHTVTPGENLWSIVRNIMETQDVNGFNEITDVNAQNNLIANAISKLPSDPQGYNIIKPGSVIDLTKAFTK